MLTKHSRLLQRKFCVTSVENVERRCVMVVKCGGGREVSRLEVSRRETSLGARNGVCGCVCVGGKVE